MGLDRLLARFTDYFCYGRGLVCRLSKRRQKVPTTFHSQTQRPLDRFHLRWAWQQHHGPSHRLEDRALLDRRLY